jgi:RTX calcium-binding nonapeptide repeat (4 copies)
VRLGNGINSVSVSSTGTVIGYLAGIFSGGSTTLVNAGEIISSTADGVDLFGGNNSVSNSGFIFGKTLGLQSLGGSDITNYGLVQGGTDDGIRLTFNNNIIRNFGTIDGAQDGIQIGGISTTAIQTIINWGTIIGRGDQGINTTGFSNDVIINRGSIQGIYAVNTQGGNDVFDNSFGGVVAGAILMGAGDDLVIAGQGAETINGEAGSDTVSYINHPRAVLINLTGQVTADGIATDTLASFENAIGSAFNDAIHGDNGVNLLDGGPGGSDQIFGNGGSDTVSYSSAVRAVLINLAGQVTADGVDTDTLSSIENAIGSRFNDTILGDGGDNVLDGGVEGSDQISGGLGIDTVSYATSARAVLINLAGQVTADGINTDNLSSIENAAGSAFNDNMIGNGLDNVLDGGAGADFLTGGGGNDAFVFQRGQANGDTIADFAGNGPLPGDILEFVGYGAGTFTQIDATHWQVNSEDGVTHETITFQNGAAVHSSEVLFL